MATGNRVRPDWWPAWASALRALARPANVDTSTCDAPVTARPTAITGEPAWDDAVPRQRLVIGDPGAAARRVVPQPTHATPDVHGVVLDAARVTGPEHSVDVRAASIRGLAHQYYRRPREDEFAFRVTPDDRYLVVAVADGVSGGQESAYAARVAADAACTLVVEYLAGEDPDPPPWRWLVETVSRAVERVGHPRLDADAPRSRSAVAIHMATTLLVAVLDLAGRGDMVEVQVARVGDSAASVLTPGGQWRSVFAAEGPGQGLAEPTTRALPCAAVVTTWTATHFRAGEALVMYTDGVGDPLGSGVGEVGDVLGRAWSSCPSLLDYAAQVDFARRSFDDDRTAVAIWIRPRGI